MLVNHAFALNRLYYTADQCEHECLDHGYEFCATTDYTAGHCCEGEGGCPTSVRAEAPICSSNVEFSLLQHFLCPFNLNCGAEKMVYATEERQRLAIDPAQAYLPAGDICSYMLTAGDFEEGDMVEISGVDTHLVDLTLFFGGYSPTSSNKALRLTSGKRYMLDG